MTSVAPTFEPSSSCTPDQQHSEKHEALSTKAECVASNAATSAAAPKNSVEPPSELKIHYYGLAMVFLCPAVGGFLYGYDIGATSFVLAMLRQAQNQEVWWSGISKFAQGLVVSSQSLGALLGSHIVLVYLANSVDRRKEIRIAAVLYIVGILCNIVAGTILNSSSLYLCGDTSWGLVALVLGRLLFGAGVGFVMHGVSIALHAIALPFTRPCLTLTPFVARHQPTWPK